MFDKDIWQEIELIFWRDSVGCLPAGTTGDGIEAVSVETSKRGVVITGVIWFLPVGKYDLDLCLSRPAFSSIESVSISRLRGAVIADSMLEKQKLKILVKYAR